MQNSYLIPNAPRIDLMNLLDELSAKRLIYVCAPAGYGKSFSIRMWQSRRGFPGAWLAVNESAGSKPNEFCERFIGSLLALQPTNADLKENMLHKSFSAAPFEFIGQAMNSFRLEALQNPEQKYTLVIDDVHLISSRDIFKFMPALIDGLPECVMICILSRTEPHECFSKFVVKQELAIVDARQLKFSENEIKLFFESCGQKLTFRQISDVIAATDGWAIGLNAILLSGHQKAGRKQLSRYLDTFIKEEVWERWDDDRREFILRVSVVDELTPDFCRAMTGRGDSKKVLEELVRENAFISVGNENIYRFHHLFQDFLKTVLSAESEKRKNRFYQNAGDWFFKLGDYYRAVEFYIKCGSNSGITKGLKLMYDYNSPYAAVEDTLSIIRLSVDRSIADEYPFLLEVLSWAAYVEGRAEELQNLLDRYYKLFPKIVLQNPRSLITRVVVDCMDPRISMVDISKGLRKLPFKRGAKATTPSVTQSLPLFHRSGREFSTEYAFDTEENLKLLGKTVGLLMNDEYPIIEDLIRGGLLYERGNLDEAHEYAISAIVKIQENFAPEFKFSAYMLLAAILEAQNHRADAIKTLDSAKAMIEKHKAYYLNANFRAFSCRFKLTDGNIDAAKDWMRNDAVSPHDALYFYKLFQHFTTVRAYIVLGDCNSAILMLKKLQLLCEQYRRPLEVIETNILLAIAYWKKPRTNQNDALEWLENAVISASEYGYTQIFANEGAELATMLHKLQKRIAQKDYTGKISPTLVKNLYVIALTRAKNSRGMTSNITPNIKFTDRQKIVMRHLNNGLTQKETAEKMGLKPSAIKSHMILIYKKLDVSNGVDAMIKMRELGVPD